MDDVPHVGLVDAHAEGVGGHHHLGAAEEEVLLVPPPLLRLQSGVVAGDGQALLPEEIADLLHVLPGGAVDDAALAAMFPHRLEQGGTLHLRLADLEVQILPVKARHLDEGVPELQQALDVLPDPGGGGGGKGPHHGAPGQTVQKGGNVQIGGAEALAPLGDAVGLVHSDQGDVRVLRKGAKALGLQPLRRHIDDLVPSGLGPAQGQLILAVGQGAVEKGGGDAGLHQRCHLIPHQGHQRGHHQRDPRQQQRRDLIADGLPAAGGHDVQHVPALQQGVHHGLLAGAEGVVAEIGFQTLGFCHGGPRKKKAVGDTAFRITAPAGSGQCSAWRRWIFWWGTSGTRATSPH